MTARYPHTVLGTCCLPWRADMTLDVPLFKRSIHGLVKAGLKDLYVFGTAGALPRQSTGRLLLPPRCCGDVHSQHDQARR